MNKKILLTFLFALFMILSVSAISASDVNVADLDSTDVADDMSDISVSNDNGDSSVLSASSESNVDNESSIVSESENSNTLSTNSDSNSAADDTLEGNSQIDVSDTVVAKDVTKYYKGSSKYVVTFYDNYGNPLVNTNVTIHVNKDSYVRTTNNDGVVSLAINRQPGSYTIVSENPVTGYNSSNTFKILPTVVATDVTKYYKGSAKYVATFFTSEGKPLANRNVKITVNTDSYTRKTNDEGVVSLSINRKPGTYKIVAYDPVTGYKATNNFKILSTISASSVTKVYTDSKKFYATFLTSSGKALANKYIKFKINGKTFSKKTNSNGVASLSMKSLRPNTYKMVSYNVDGLTKTNTVKVISKSSTKITTSDYTFLKTDSKTIKATLTNSLGYAPDTGQVIKFTVNGKTYSAKTNSKGVASLNLPTLNAGTYTVKYSFAGTSVYGASSASNKLYILPSETPTFTVKSTTTFGKGANTPFKVALTSGSVPLVKKTVILTVNGKSYTKTTDSNGIVSLTIGLNVGEYTMAYKFDGDSKVNAKNESCDIKVVNRAPTNITWKSGTSFYQGSESYKVLLQDENGKALSGKSVQLTVNGKSYSATTDSSGYAKFTVSIATAGNYTVSFNFAATGDNTYAPSSGSAKITVKAPDTISIKNIVTGATNLKSYYASNNKLPSTVTTGGIKFTLAEFTYLMSQAIDQLGKSNTKDVSIMYGVGAPSSPSGDNIYSKALAKADYLKVALNVANYIKDNKVAPGSASSAVGKIIYSEYVDAFSRILEFYGSNSRLPTTVTITYTSGSSSASGHGLNEKCTETDLDKYLKATKNCQVDASSIKSIVNTVTKGLTSVKDKATAIYNYVRDNLDYSFYYNTKYGATGALSAKKGNCVDHSHLLVAMFRTADIPARYVHGTCTFSSGSTYGHVWAQVLVDGQWTVADATSSRNSLGSIANWNTKTFSVSEITNEISF